MPKLDNVLSLISAIGKRDYSYAKRTVEVMIANERGNKREQAAKSLEQALSRWPNNSLVELPSEVKSIAWAEDAKLRLDSLYLDPLLNTEIQRFLKEWAMMEQLREAGLPVRNKLLLAGPPGNGKTSLAETLAQSLNITFLPIKLHALISSTMGSTGGEIGKLFEYAMFNNSLVFLDELEAIGSTRKEGGLGSDKEYNSIVNVLLTNIDRLPDTSIFIGATNRPEMLDSALLRRFNLKLWLDIPPSTQIGKYLMDYQAMHSIEFVEPLSQLVNEMESCSWSRINEFCASKHRSIILGEGKGFTGEWVGRGAFTSEVTNG